jgi:lipase ATG15
METKCHTGSSCVYDTKSKLGWRSNIKNHGIVPFIEIIDKWYDITNGKEHVASCTKKEDCKDCQHWNFI